MLVELGIIDVDHAGLRECRQHFVRALGSVVRARLQCGRTESGVKAGKPVPCFVDYNLDALGMRCLNNGAQIVPQAIISTTGEYKRLCIGMFFDGMEQRLFRYRSVNTEFLALR